MTPTAHTRLDDLPRPYREQAARQLAALALRGTIAPREAPSTALGPDRGGKGAKNAKQPKQPNKTETRYLREVLDRRGDVLCVRYEGVTLRMGNGHRYTPDFLVTRHDGRMECHEVKGSYRLHSYGRARLAFDQERVEFGGLIWVWAVWTGTAWKVEGAQ